MTETQLEELFEKHSDEYLEFEKIKNPKHVRKDICAMLMIDEIQCRNYRQTSNIISYSGHDEIWFDIYSEDFSEVITETEVIDLIRCGIRLSENNLTMFV